MGIRIRRGNDEESILSPRKEFVGSAETIKKKTIGEGVGGSRDSNVFGRKWQRLRLRRAGARPSRERTVTAEGCLSNRGDLCPPSGNFSAP